MKYRIPTHRHHNGFSIIQSILTPYNVADAAPLLTIPSAAPARFVSTYRIAPSNPSASPLLTPE